MATGLAATLLAACRRGTVAPTAAIEASTGAVPSAGASVPSTTAAAASAISAPGGTTTSVAPPAALPAVPARTVPGMSIVTGRPTDRSFTLSLLADVEHTVEVRHRPTGGSGNRPVASLVLPAGQPAQVELDGLEAGRAGTFELVIDGESAGERRFRTARAPGEPFVVTVDADPHYGDSRFDGALYRATLQNAAGDEPDFHINLGDTFMTEKLRPTSRADAAVAFAELHAYFGVFDGNVPLLLVNGNHEAELGWLAARDATKDQALWSTELRQAYYPHPVPGSFYGGATLADPRLGTPRDSYYAWTWGDCLFVVLDPFWYTTDKPRSGVSDANWGWTLGEAQYRWLVSTLASSRAHHKLVFVHHLVGGGSEARGGVEVAGSFEWGGRNADGSDGFELHRRGWGRPIHQVLLDSGVGAVFHGHDHVYVHQQLDGIVYQLLPQPSNAQAATAHLATEYGYRSGEVVDGAGHLRLTVGPTAVVGEFVRVRRETPGQGEVAHRFEILRRS